jgi:N-acetylglucosaminyldiphosphoundecaprenol N-acetyl-beta-D-mannosaminyltransferase
MERQPVTSDRVCIAGLEILNLPEYCLYRAIVKTADEALPATVYLANAHMIATAHRSPELMACMERSAFVVADGMSLVGAARLEGQRLYRVRGADLMRGLCNEARHHQMPVAIVGGAHETLTRVVQNLQATIAGLRVSFAFAPRFGALTVDESTHIATAARASGARILFLGLGCPKQELWADRFVSVAGMPIVCVGAAFDFLAGTKPEAPRWMRDRGAEWLFRLGCEPQRLWKRYLTTNVEFAWLVAKQIGRRRIKHVTDVREELRHRGRPL